MGQMRMISKITIRNFQTHKKSELEFTDGVNLIVGSSDNGKSSVIRAFRWLAENSQQDSLSDGGTLQTRV